MTTLKSLAAQMDAFCDALREHIKSHPDSRTIQYADQPPTNEKDEKATIDAIAERCFGPNTVERSKLCAEQILNAIKAGDIPGLWYNQQIATEKNALILDNMKLRTVVTELEKSIKYWQQNAAHWKSEHEEAWKIVNLKGTK